MTIYNNSSSVLTGENIETKVTIEKLKTIVMFLTTKYAQTKEECFAEAAYQHLCMINDHDDADSELKFFCQSLVMDWKSIAGGGVNYHQYLKMSRS